MIEQTPTDSLVPPEQIGANSADLVREAVADAIPGIAMRNVVCGTEVPYVFVAPEVIEAEEDTAPKRRHLARAVGAIAGTAFFLSFASGLLASEKAEAATLPDGHSLVTPDNHVSTTPPIGPDPETTSNNTTDLDLSKYTTAPAERQVSFVAAGANNIEHNTFRVMTYNILRSGKFFGEPKARMGKVAYMLKQSADAAWGGPYARIQRAIQVMKESGAEIIGGQEQAPEQIGWIQKGLAKLGYKAFPKDKPYEMTTYVDTDRFEVLQTGTLNMPTYGDRPGKSTGKAVWLKLKDKLAPNHDIIYTLNSHPVAHDTTYDRGGAVKRWLSNKVKTQFWKQIELENPDANGIDMGDNNSTNMLRLIPDKLTPIVKDTWLKAKFGAEARTKLAYCMLTQKGLLKDPNQSLLQDTLDEVRGITGWCKDKSMEYVRHFNVDWIYKTRNIVATKWRQIWSKPALTASDHKPVVAEMYVNQDESE